MALDFTTSLIKLNNQYTIIENTSDIADNYEAKRGELFFLPPVNGVRECKIGDGKTPFKDLPLAGCVTLADDATNKAGAVKPGGDVTITNGIITLNENSHNHTVSIQDSDGTSSKTLSYGSKYKIVVGGNEYIFTMPSHPANKNIVGTSATATSNGAVTTSTGVFLNHLEGTTVKSSNKIIGSGGTTVTSDSSGTITINSDNTKVTSASNHYEPQTASGYALESDSSATASATWGSTELITGIKLNRDSKGHVTGISVDAVKMPAEPSLNGTAVNTATKADSVKFQELSSSTGYSLLLNPNNNTTAAAPGYSTAIKYNPSSKYLYPASSGTTSLGTSSYQWSAVHSVKGVFVNDAAGTSTDVSLACGTSANVSATQLRVGNAGTYAKDVLGFKRTDNGSISAYGNALFGADASGFGMFRFPSSGSSNMIGSYGVDGWIWSITRDGSAGFKQLAVGGKTVATVDDASILINKLGLGTSAPTDDDYYIAQYAGGGTTNTSYYRRPHSALRTYLQNNLKLSAACITSGTLPITRGGTGATTAAGARLNLGAADATLIYKDSSTNAVFIASTSTIYTNRGAASYIFQYKKTSDATSLTENARFDTGGHLIPGTSATHNLGSGGISGKRWLTVYSKNIDLTNDQYYTDGDWALNLNNSDVVGANAIYFKDPADSMGEGLAFASNTTDVYHNFYLNASGTPYIKKSVNRTLKSGTGSWKDTTAIKVLTSADFSLSGSILTITTT